MYFITPYFFISLKNLLSILFLFTKKKLPFDSYTLIVKFG